MRPILKRYKVITRHFYGQARQPFAVRLGILFIEAIK
jgi:hypothetical protein